MASQVSRCGSRNGNGYQTFFNSIQRTLTGYGEPLPVFCVPVAWVQLLSNARLSAGPRAPAREECQKGGRPAVPLNYTFRQRQSAANAPIVGQAIRLNEQAVTIVHVLPNTFDFGSVLPPGLKVDLYGPAIIDYWRKVGICSRSLAGSVAPALLEYADRQLGSVLASLGIYCVISYSVTR